MRRVERAGSGRNRSVVLVLFALSHDQPELRRLAKRRPDLEFIQEGFDLFRAPQNLRLLTFDIERFVESLLRRYRQRRIVAVISAHEQFGALAAAMASERLELPGSPIAAILKAQNKYVARQIHAQYLPQHTPAFCAFRYDADPRTAVTIDYPVFVKPVKAAFSVLARRCDNPEQLAQHLRLGWWEMIVIKALTRPFRHVSARYLDSPIDADCFIAETLIEDAVQVCVDGYAEHGRIEALAVVDAVMYPGTQAFMRFELPSRLPPSLQARMKELAKQAVSALGFTHGLFNVELLWQPKTDSLWIVEVNPRMAAQFADLYARVEGRSLWDIQLALALGEPIPVRKQGEFGAAASFVFREFGQARKKAPDQASLAWLRNCYPDAELFLDLKDGRARRREQRWVGSYRYALLHMGGRDHDDLLHRHARALEHLDFAAPAQSNSSGILRRLVQPDRPV